MSTFEVRDVLSLDDLKREFDLVGLTELYDQFVPSFIWQDSCCVNAHSLCNTHSLHWVGPHFQKK